MLPFFLMRKLDLSVVQWPTWRNGKKKKQMKSVSAIFVCSSSTFNILHALYICEMKSHIIGTDVQLLGEREDLASEPKLSLSLINQQVWGDDWENVLEVPLHWESPPLYTLSYISAPNPQMGQWTAPFLLFPFSFTWRCKLADAFSLDKTCPKLNVLATSLELPPTTPSTIWLNSVLELALTFSFRFVSSSSWSVASRLLRL